VSIPTSPDHLGLLTVTLVDLRATLEAAFRTLNAAEACANQYRTHGDASALADATKHLDSLQAQHTAGGGAVADARSALAALIASLSSAPHQPKLWLFCAAGLGA
jgi:hypothetical protein